MKYLASKYGWTSDDEALILLTKDAEERNWNDNGGLKGLSSVIQQMEPQVTVNVLKDLPKGETENEILLIFSLMYNHIQDGDELYFDLTHGFRYLPMLTLVLGKYSGFLKKTSIKSITYGNWEMSANGSKPAPIIDLLSLSVLQDWTFAAGQFLESGNPNSLKHNSENEYKPILIATQGDDDSARLLQKFIWNLERVITERRLCRGKDIFEGGSISKLNSAYEDLTRVIDQTKPYTPIFQRIRDSWSDFNDTADVLNGIRAADWCYEQGLYLQCSVSLTETVSYYLCKEVLHKNPDDEDSQKCITGALDYAANELRGQIDEEKYGEDFDTIQEAVNIIKQHFGDRYRDIVNSMIELKKVRNDFAHFGIRKVPGRPDTLRNNLKNQMGKIKDVLSGLKEFSKITKTEGEVVFINLSNHPSEHWSKLQFDAARQYGKIVDIPFPRIQPSYTREEITAISEEMVSNIVKEYPKGAVIHVMGEMTLTFSLVSELKTLGYTCLASTTERVVSQKSEDEKLVHFDFIRFREY